MKARVRQDILDSHLKVPIKPAILDKASDLICIDWSKCYDSWQPSSYEDEECNLFLDVPGVGIILAKSIDFDFFTNEEAESFENSNRGNNE
jgi:hypothetical protein